MVPLALCTCSVIKVKSRLLGITITTGNFSIVHQHKIEISVKNHTVIQIKATEKDSCMGYKYLHSIPSNKILNFINLIGNFKSMHDEESRQVHVIVVLK